MTTRIFGHLSAVLLALSLIAAPLLAFGQGIVKAQYGDWQMSCDTPPGASFEQCAIIQNVTAEDQPNVGQLGSEGADYWIEVALVERDAGRPEFRCDPPCPRF